MMACVHYASTILYAALCLIVVMTMGGMPMMLKHQRQQELYLCGTTRGRACTAGSTELECHSGDLGGSDTNNGMEGVALERLYNFNLVIVGPVSQGLS